MLRLRSGTTGGGGDLTFRFQHTPASEVRRLDSLDDLDALLTTEAARADATAEKWMRQPTTQWVSQMVHELEPAQRASLAEVHRTLQASVMPESDTFGRWAELADFAGSVVDLWLEGRSLENVLDRARELGHLDPGLQGGCVLEGAYVQDLAAAEDTSLERLRPALHRLSSGSETVSIYQVQPENCFRQDQRHRWPLRQLESNDGQGSLNTTWTFVDDELSGVDLLDEFYDLVDEAADACDAVELNRRIYLIWKFQHYVTSYHQDTHVPPHFTIYNQVSGFSMFHFLPLLVGIYVTHVGRRNVKKLGPLLEELDRRQIGSLATIGPGQVAFILPSGSHGVWVPSSAYNPMMPPFEISLIRAAELYLSQLRETCNQQLRDKRWNTVTEHTTNELAQVRLFIAAQEAICHTMSLSKKDWKWLAQMTKEHWEDAVEETSDDSGATE